MTACTIIFRNYLPHATILARSFAQHMPGRQFYCLVLDGLPSRTKVDPSLSIMTPADLKLPHFDDLRAKYDVTELSTAVKPTFLARLLEKRADQVAYFDPDIMVFRPLEELSDAMRSASIVLTPHLLKPIPLDGLKPSEQDILLSGVYNLGFLGVRLCAETAAFLKWWEERLRDHCRIDHANGLFTDQRWVDLVPGMFPATVIFRDPTYNVAYWNLHERQLEKRGGQCLVNGRPLAFYHFSGFNPARPTELSKHQTRVSVEPGSALAELLADYAALHAKYACRASQSSRAARKAITFGVNVAGYIGSEKGVGEGVRSDIRALEAAGIPFVLNNFADPTARNRDHTYRRFSAENPYPINLVHINPHDVRMFVRQQSAGYFQGRRNIGYWAWELSEFPAPWRDSFRWFDEIWVPSRFTLDAVSRLSPVPVVRIPHCVPASPPTRCTGRARFGLRPDEFVFLFIFDCASSLERKNPLGLIRAFQLAALDKARLVLKCSHATPAQLGALRRATGRAAVTIFDKVMDRGDVNALMARADCYVSLHRSEGFGLTIAEAMVLKKPIIATGYSGNLDFMTPSNSLLVKYRLCEIQRDDGLYKKGFVWAEPDTAHAAELMHHVVEHPAAARALGHAARNDIATGFSPRVIGAMMKQRLQPPATNDYEHLVARIRDAIHSVVPADATLLVVSKGDGELLKLENRRAWHFPRLADGRYAGHHPADSAAAIAHLEKLRAQGGRYFLLPQTSFWWLEHYAGLRRHLGKNYRRVIRSEDSCILYDLTR